MKRILRIGKYFVEFIFAQVIAFFVKRFNPKYKNVWIISERGSDARDNGYFFYKYLCKNHPQQKVYYIINSASADAPKIAPHHRVQPGSLKHFIMFALCRVRISSHAFGGDIPFADYYKKSGLYKLSRKKSVFLQHGITKDFQPNLCYPQFCTDLFVCGAKPEFDYIRDNFGHKKGAVQYTGFARYDSLCDFTTKNQILVMPTFRKWLQGLEEDEFTKQEYFKSWLWFINNPVLAKLLEKTNTKLIFYPHIEMQRYVSLFTTASDKITIADFNHYDVQTLLKESKLLITDFSSVFFDFAYMKKPVIFYHFDRQRYIKDHYDFTKGYFDYDGMAPGKVVFFEDDLVKEIIDTFKNDFAVKDQYAARNSVFFTLHDTNNCRRIYEQINKLLTQ